MNSERKIHNLWLLQLFADMFAICSAYYTALYLRFRSEVGEGIFAILNDVLDVHSDLQGDSFQLFYVTSAVRILLIMTVVVVVLYALLDLYPGRRFIRRRPAAWHILMANVAALMLFYVYFYLQRNVFHPRSFFVTVVLFNVLYGVIARSIVDGLLRWLRENRGIDRWRTCLLGQTREADYINTLVQGVHPHGLEISLRLNPGKDFNLKQLEKELDGSRPDMIIAAQKEMPVSEIMKLLELADKFDVPVKVLSDKLNVIVSNARMPADMILGTPLVHFEKPSVSRQFELWRKLYSAFLGGIMLMLLSPLLAVIAALTKLTSRGPAFFVQERIGVNRKPFKMYKFRTMYVGSDELQAQVEEFNESGGGLFKIRNDPRITPLGSLLRRFSLDELPQFVNVAKGEMFIVGPRPLPRRDFENYYEEWHYSRHSGMPGLTCLWQVSGRSDLDFHNMCILDVYYLRNRNWVLDLKIVLRTMWVVLFAKGAY